MLSGRADSGESRMREICMSGSTRERGAAVIDAIVFHSVLSSLLYRLHSERNGIPGVAVFSERVRSEIFSVDEPWIAAPDHLVVYFINTHTFVAPNLARGEARGRECIRSDTRPTEQRSHGPNWAQPTGRHVFWPEASLLAPYRSAAGYARRSRLASAQNPLPRTCAYL